MLAERLTSGIEFLTLLGTIVTIMLAVALIVSLRSKEENFSKKITNFLAKHYLLFGFTLVTIATLGSLFYSEIINYDPCVLCWWQRIFMFPLPIIFLVSILKKEKSVIWSSLIMSILGGAVALYQYLTQIGMVNKSVCDFLQTSVSCSEYYSLAYGFVTIPLMSVIIFTLVIILSVSKLISKK